MGISQNPGVANFLVRKVTPVAVGKKRLTKKDKKFGHEALRDFFGLAKNWRLSDDEQMAILGLKDKEQFKKYHDAKDLTLDEQQLTRLSHIFWIDDYLHGLLSDDESADSWLRRTDDMGLALFDNETKTPLKKMMTGRVDDIADVRYYLEHECCG